MDWLIALLGVVSVVANATMDELRFHWDRLFGKIAKPGTKLEKWMNPSISWINKYPFKSSILNYIVGTVFVWFTDFWHMLKAIHLNAIFMAVLLLINSTLSFKEYIFPLVLMNVLWGFFFELTFGIYGTISDYIKPKK